MFLPFEEIDSRIRILEKNHPCLGPLPYFECGPGWFAITEMFFERIAQRLENLSRSHSISLSIRVSQVKEKFGSLRVYYTFPDTNDIKFNLGAYIDGAINILDGVASITCSICGLNKPNTQKYCSTCTTINEVHNS